VASAGGKYVFTHESGKFLGVCGGQVCGLEKRQHERPQQDITSDFTVVTISEGTSVAARTAAVPSARAAVVSKVAAPAEPPSAGDNDPFAFHPAPASPVNSKRNRKPAHDHASKKVTKPDISTVPTKRSRASSSANSDTSAPAVTASTAAAAAAAAAVAVASHDSDDDKPFKFPRAAPAKSDSKPIPSSKSPSKPPTSQPPECAASPLDVQSRSRRSAAAVPISAPALAGPGMVAKRARTTDRTNDSSAEPVSTAQQQMNPKGSSEAPDKLAGKQDSLELPQSFAL
jgi:hypothetical protein